MGLGSGWHWILFLLVAVLLFGGGGKISSLMGDVAKGIKSFKKGMSEDDEATVRKPAAPDPRVIDQTATRPAEGERSKTG
jgi:sec-independent protein translocase protein TatA